MPLTLRHDVIARISYEEEEAADTMVAAVARWQFGCLFTTPLRSELFCRESGVLAAAPVSVCFFTIPSAARSLFSAAHEARQRVRG